MLSIFIQHSNVKLAMCRSLCRLSSFFQLVKLQRKTNAIQGSEAKQYWIEQKKLQSNLEVAVAAYWAVHCN